MASSQPIIKQIAWSSLVTQLLVLGAFWMVAYRLTPDYFITLGAIGYLFLSWVLRYALAWQHRRGIKLFKAKRYAEAIPSFEKSYAFFEKNKWLDKWRYLTLLSSSRISYREMALLNVAFCQAQIGNGREARRVYEWTLSEFPGSEIAQAGLRMLTLGNDGAVSSPVG